MSLATVWISPILEAPQEAGEGMFIYEDLVQVSATGYELITTESTELVVIDA